MDLLKPRKQVIRNKNFPCEKCHKLFSTKFSMQRHTRECGVAPNRVECEKCKKSLKNLEILEKHRVICFGLAKKVICSYCDELFSSQFSLRRHLWRFHQNEDLPKQQLTIKQEPQEDGNTSMTRENITREKRILNYTLPKTELHDKTEICYYYMDVCYDYEYLEDEFLDSDKPLIYPPVKIED